MECGFNETGDNFWFRSWSGFGVGLGYLVASLAMSLFDSTLAASFLLGAGAVALFGLGLFHGRTMRRKEEDFRARR